MVFRHDQNPIVWSSPSQFQPGHAVSKTLVTLDRRLGVVTSASSEQETGLFVGTRDGLLWRFMASQQDDRSFKAVATCCELLDVCSIWSALRVLVWGGASVLISFCAIRSRSLHYKYCTTRMIQGAFQRT